MKDSRDLPRIVGNTAVGKDVEVLIMRKGKEVTRTVKLGRLEDGEKLAKASTQPNAGEVDKPVVKKALGIEMSSITEELRKRFNIKENVKGVVVTRVEPNTQAADKRIAMGDVILEVQQEPVTNPDALTRRIDALKKEGRKSALLLVMSAQSEHPRFVSLGIE